MKNGDDDGTRFSSTRVWTQQRRRRIDQRGLYRNTEVTDERRFVGLTREILYGLLR